MSPSITGGLCHLKCDNRSQICPCRAPQMFKMSKKFKMLKMLKCDWLDKSNLLFQTRSNSGISQCSTGGFGSVAAAMLLSCQGTKNF